MRVRTVLSVFTLAACAGFAAACSAPAPAPAEAPAASAAPAQQVQGTLNQVMRGILFPNSNIIFDTQDKDPGAPVDPAVGASPYAGTYGGWEAVENAAIALGEAANLVALPGRTCANGKPVPLNEPVFQKGLQALRDVSTETLDAAKTKTYDADKMLALADKVTMACATCHDVYRDKVVDGKPIGIEDRCVS
jgi:hypothetical protein